jgi:hypothetical protein
VDVRIPGDIGGDAEIHGIGQFRSADEPDGDVDA